jgi:two-component system nitrate/nitrite response regulator NarL
MAPGAPMRGNGPVPHPTERRAVRVVIADDHDTYRQGLARTIRRFGSLRLVGEASDGQEALDLIREASPDVAVVDVRMPGLDGLEIARRLRELGGVDVVLLTGSDTAGLQAAARDAGARELLSKELARDEICTHLLAAR